MRDFFSFQPTDRSFYKPEAERSVKGRPEGATSEASLPLTRAERRAKYLAGRSGKEIPPFFSAVY